MRRVILGAAMAAVVLVQAPAQAQQAQPAQPAPAPAKPGAGPSPQPAGETAPAPQEAPQAPTEAPQPQAASEAADPQAESAETATPAQAQPATAPVAAAGTAAASAATAPATAPGTADSAAKPGPHAFVPPADGNDWVGLKNGEWLQGEFLTMRDGDLYFDSDEFDEQKLDWSDVAELHLRRPTIFVTEELDAFEGTGVIKADGELVLQTEQGEKRMPHGDVMGIVGGAGSELDHWKLEADLGLSVTAGNTNQGTLNVHTKLKREGEFSRGTLQYDFNLGWTKVPPATDASETVNNHRGLGQFDIFISRVFYVTPAFITIENDRFRNWDIRVVPGAGAGMHILKSKLLDWDFELGGAYTYTDYTTVLAGQESDESDGAMRLFTSLEFELTSDVDFDVSHYTLLVLSRLGRTQHHSEAKLEVEITDIFDINFKFVFDRMEEPVTNDQGVTPEQNDYQLIAGLGIDLG